MRELAAALSSDPAYPAILYPVLLEVISELIHEGTGCCDPEYLAILCPGYSVLGEVVSHSHD